MSNKPKNFSAKNRKQTARRENAAKHVNKFLPPEVDSRELALKPGQRPWSEEVAERLEKKAAREALNGPDSRDGKCTALTTGKWGPKRPCERWAILGGNVCYMHGGAIKKVKDAAETRFKEELYPTIRRLTEIRDQDDHMPSALGASLAIVNRAIGKQGAPEAAGGDKRPIINIGINLGGLPNRPQLAVTNTIEAETVDE